MSIFHIKKHKQSLSFIIFFSLTIAQKQTKEKLYIDLNHYEMLLHSVRSAIHFFVLMYFSRCSKKSRCLKYSARFANTACSRT